MAQAQVSVYAGAYALLQGEGTPPPSQPNMDSGHMSQWGAARLVALAPHHLGESIHGERTQGVIRVSDSAFYITNYLLIYNT